MNKIVLLALSAIVASVVRSEPEVKQADPAAPYNSYGPAMTSTDENPLTSAWQKKERKAIDEATKDATLASFVADEDAARILLLKVDGAFTTDPMTLTQIAAVTQWVMIPDKWYYFFCDGPHAAGRKIWTKKLLELADESDNTYVKIFCLDQLRFCAYCSQAEDVLGIGAAANDKNVRAVAELVARGLKKR